ncbi:hypothetical protein EW026_g6627 [Hermanssonia centrifuga]|uniref:MFS general substrate transporter n=1 Tax=Hermanssonia centrifuga TaxID=98765 RepID=A0A4S4KAF9_9APHY|nr:hypothetical protein EW026_g6627 [Hermanssonia centrifuga]
MSSSHSSEKDLEEDVQVKPAPHNVYRPEIDVSGIDEAKLLRRIDWHVVPWLAVLYLLNFLDRGNIGNARLYHMQDDLHITDKQYLIALTVFFFPYALFETMHGLIHNYAGLVGLRVLLGLAEAGLYPGVVFYMSCWYKRSELGTRVAVFFSSATVAGAFSGLLAAAISNMDGVGGKPGWAWIFILEGIFTVLCAIASFWILADFPDSAKFLTETEHWKTWVAMGIYMGFDGPLFAFSLFTPTIINQLGFQATAANLLSVPVYAWACLVTLAVGVLANSVAWVSSNVEGSYKRSATLGMAIGWGNLNGAITSNVYRAQDKPWYRLGHGIVLAYIAIGWLCSLLFFLLLRKENARRDAGQRDEVLEGVDNLNANEKNGHFKDVQEARLEKGDQWSGFRYTL